MSHADASLLDAAWATAKAMRGEPVTYQSGSAEVELTAIFSRPEVSQVDGEENFVFTSRNWDVLIDASWPSNAPGAFSGLKPAQGDKIIRADGSEYYVQPSDATGLCWRWSDGAHTFRRVFTEER